MNTEERLQYIETQLKSHFSPSSLEIEDESHLHVGHASAKGGGHFKVTLVSDAFTGKSLIERHRLVYAAMGDAMKHEIHALSIKANSPSDKNT